MYGRVWGGFFIGNGGVTHRKLAPDRTGPCLAYPAERSGGMFARTLPSLSILPETRKNNIH